MASSEAEENVSPANYFYEGLPQLLPEYDSLLIQLAVLHLTVWQVVYDLGKGVGRPPVEVWVETLRRIPSKEANPLEELSCQAPAEEITEEIEEVSLDDNEQDEQEEQEQQAQEGTEENPVDVERDTDSPQVRIVDSHRVFDHPASAGFRYRRASGQQFRIGERRGPYL